MNKSRGRGNYRSPISMRYPKTPNAPSILAILCSDVGQKMCSLETAMRSRRWIWIIIIIRTRQGKNRTIRNAHLVFFSSSSICKAESTEAAAVNMVMVIGMENNRSEIEV
jgi:hypothetical protein